MTLFKLIVLYWIGRFVWRFIQGMNKQSRRVSTPLPEELEEVAVEPLRQPRARARMVKAAPTLEHKETQHKATLHAAAAPVLEVAKPQRLPTTAQTGFIMAEILGKPRALKGWEA